VDVDDLRAAFDLVASDTECFLVLSGKNEFGKLRRARHIRAFADVHEAQVRTERQRLQAAQSKVWLRPWDRARLERANRFCNRSDVFRCRSATSADDVQPAIGREIA